MTQEPKLYDNIIIEEYYICYFLNGEYHRSDGPAVIGYNHHGTIEIERYYLNGNQHRIDGPAVIIYYDDGRIAYKYHYLNNRYLSKQEFRRKCKTTTK